MRQDDRSLSPLSLIIVIRYLLSIAPVYPLRTGHGPRSLNVKETEPDRAEEEAEGVVVGEGVVLVKNLPPRAPALGQLLRVGAAKRYYAIVFFIPTAEARAVVVHVALLLLLHELGLVVGLTRGVGGVG